MTVKIGMGGSALDLKDAQVWGSPANKIMVGTGTSAVEVWSSLPYPINNTWDLRAGSSFTDSRIAEHVILAAGSYTITNTVTYVYGAAIGTGSVMALISSGQSNAVGSSGISSTATTTLSLVKGDVVTLGGLFNNSHVYEGNWSIVKN